MQSFQLRSGCIIEQPRNRLLAFCREEYAFYDAIPMGDPNKVEPLDVLTAVAMNAFIGGGAARIRTVQRGLDEACSRFFAKIPPTAELWDSDPVQLELPKLLESACQTRGVLIPTATKVLHRKRPKLIPILDNVELAYYLNVRPEKIPQGKNQIEIVAAEVLTLFRNDLCNAKSEVNEIRRVMEAEGYHLTSVRALETLLWIHTEPKGYYRDGEPPCKRIS